MEYKMLLAFYVEEEPRNNGFYQYLDDKLIVVTGYCWKFNTSDVEDHSQRHDAKLVIRPRTVLYLNESE